MSCLTSHFCWQDRSEDTESEQGGFVTCRAASPGSTQGLIGYYRDLLSDHNLPSLSRFSPGKRLGFTGPTGLWASETSLATASLSDPCCICAPSQSLGCRMKRAAGTVIWLCQVVEGEMLSKQGLLSLPPCKSAFYLYIVHICISMYFCCHKFLQP